MEFVLIRHPPCDAPQGMCYGHLDLPLRASADADIARMLDKTPAVDAVFTSPSERCTRLTRQLAQRDTCALTVLDDLRELNFGAWEGMRWDEIPRSMSDFWAEDPWHRAPPDGESEAELFARVERAYGLIASNKATRVGIVAHGGPLRLLRCLILGLPIEERWNWSIEPGDVYAVTASMKTASTDSPLERSDFHRDD